MLTVSKFILIQENTFLSHARILYSYSESDKILKQIDMNFMAWSSWTLRTNGQFFENATKPAEIYPNDDVMFLHNSSQVFKDFVAFLEKK